jgi:hypothetical protein
MNCVGFELELELKEGYGEFCSKRYFKKHQGYSRLLDLKSYTGRLYLSENLIFGSKS